MSNQTRPLRTEGILSKIFEGDKRLWLLYATFIIVSFFAVSSASSARMYSFLMSQQGINPVFKHVVVLLFCLGTAVIVSKFPVEWYRRKKYLLALIVGVFIVALWLNPTEANQASRWTRIMGISIQPSEFFKLIIVLYGAEIGAKVAKMRREHFPLAKKYAHLFFLIYWFVIVAITLSINLTNLSTTFILISFLFLYTITLRAPLSFILRVFVLLFVAGALLVSALLFIPEDTLRKIHHRSPVWQQRLYHIAEDPSSDKEYYNLEEGSTQSKLALVAISRGQVPSGLGKSKTRDYLPLAYSDYIYAIIVEEWGVVGMLFVPSLYLLWFLWVGRLAQREENMYRRYVLLGFGLLYPFSALINLMVASGMFITGQPLPLISDGGSSYLSASIAVGIVIGISRSQTKIRELDRREQEILSAAETEA